jgi:hypothetical protein
MRIATWRWWELGIFWLLSGVLALALLQVAIARRFPRGFFWLIPYPHWRALPGTLSEWLRHELPLAFYGLVVVAITVLGVTLYWAAKRFG